MKQDLPSALDPAAPRELRPHVSPPMPPRKRRRGWIWLLLLALLGAGIYFLWPKKNVAQGTANPAGAPGPGRGPRGPVQIPIVAAKARQGDIPVYFNGLGAVTPVYTVQVQSRVTGQLMEVHFKEGDLVRQGDPLVEIDPRPFQAMLTQAEGQLVRDKALLENARTDLARYKTLVAQNAAPEQQLATQDALVKQYEGVVQYDQGLIDSAKVNIIYCHITAPITGRIGLRLVDPGNVVQAPNANPLLVITQVNPISVIFTLAEDQLPVVQQKLRAGQHLRVDAFDRNLKTKLAQGMLTTLDNQIDQTTGTLKLRATFDNRNNGLFPNQFVNARLLVQVKRGVTLAPTATIQRNSQTTYVFLVKPDSTVTVRPVVIGTTEGDDAEVTSGLEPGDVIVMTGVDKLQEGTKVSVHFAGESAPARMPGRQARVPHQ